MDLAEKIHRDFYNKSGYRNAKCNQNEDFCNGFMLGEATWEEENGLDVLYDYLDGSEYDQDSKQWKEFKRGFWAARTQIIFSNVFSN